MPSRPSSGADAARGALGRVGIEGYGGFLLAALAVLAALTALTGGGIATQPAGRVEVATALLGLLAVLGVCAGAIQIRRAPLAWLATGILTGFALWSMLSVEWSVLPEGSWLAANRALAYAVVAAVALTAAAVVPRAAVIAAVALTLTGLLVAVYALGGKLLPGIHIGVLNLDPGGRFSRISRPLDYWNALGLLCVMASPAGIWLASSVKAPSRVRIAAAITLAILVLTVALAYSRGAIVGYIVVLAVMVGAGPRRLTRLGVGLGAIVAVAPAMIVAFTRHDLSAADVPLSDRTTGGLALTAVLIACLVALALVFRRLIRLEPEVSWGPERARRTWRALGVATLIALVVGVGTISFSGKGLFTDISSEFEAFKKPGSTLTNSPDRLISSNSSSRYVWWTEALGAFSDKPLEGQGAGSFPIVHYLYRDHNAPVRSSHSLPLMFLSETGLIGFALGMGALVLLAFAAVRRVRDASGGDRSARFALLAAFTAWFVQSLFDWHWEIPGVTIPALIAVCVAAAPPVTGAARRMGTARAPLLPRPRAGALATLAVVAAIAFAVSAWLPALSEQKRLHALAIADSNPSGAADSAALARRLDPLSIEALLTQSSIAAGKNDQDGVLEPLIKASKVEPESRDVWRRLFTAYNFYGYTAQSFETLRHSIVTDPLAFRGSRADIAAEIFESRAPPGASPTAYGTPPS